MVNISVLISIFVVSLIGRFLDHMGWQVTDLFVGQRLVKSGQMIDNFIELFRVDVQT